MASFKLGDWDINPDTCIISSGDEHKKLDYKQVQLLCYLVSRQGDVVSRTELMDNIWAGQVVADDVLNVAISGLRKALGDDSRSPTYIQTIPRKGYKLLVAPAAPVQPQQHQQLTIRAQPKLTLVGIALLAVVLMLWMQPFGTKSAAGQRLAVLPFALVTADGQQQYIADGITDAVMNQIANDTELALIARASVNSIDTDTMDMAEIADSLQVEWIVEGSVQVQGEAIRVSASLVDTQSQAVRWQTSIEASKHDLFNAQLQVAREVSQRFNGTVADAIPAPSAGAYQHYIQGTYHLNQFNTDAAEQAFLAAVVADAQYAQAYAALAQTYFLRAYMATDKTWDYLQAAKRYAQQGFDLAPSNVEVRLNMALASFYLDKDYARAKILFEQAYAQKPHDMMLMEWYHSFLLASQDFDRAEQLNQQMRSASPLAFNKTSYFNVLYYQQDYEAALNEIEAVSPYMNSKLWVSGATAQVYYAQQDWQSFSQVAPNLITQLGLSNIEVEAFQQRLLQQGARAAVALFIDSAAAKLDAYSQAELWAIIGEADKAIALLKPIVANHELKAFKLHIEPAFASLHGKPEFERMLVTLQLPKRRD